MKISADTIGKSMSVSEDRTVGTAPTFDHDKARYLIHPFIVLRVGADRNVRSRISRKIELGKNDENFVIYKIF